MAQRLLPLLLLALFTVSYEAADICEILDANYCFYFSDSSCYINLCQCDACAKHDKVQSLLLEGSENNSTDSNQERLCPTWCPHVKTNETILNILGATNTTSELPDISFECEDLRDNCLAQKGYNGHCYFYEKSCEYRPDIARRGKAGKKSHIPKTAEECLRHQRKCAQKYKKHYSCKTFRRHCKKFNLTEIEQNNSTVVHNHTQTSPLEQCLNFQKICAAKYRKHFACRQYRKKCKPYNLPEIHFEESEVTQKPRHQKKMRKGHGMRKDHSNETVVVTTGEVTVGGNATLVETILEKS